MWLAISTSCTHISYVTKALGVLNPMDGCTVGTEARDTKARSHVPDSDGYNLAQA